MSKFKNKTQQPKNAAFMRKFVEALFPKHDPILYIERQNEAAESPPLIMEEEILAIAKKIKSNKAPGIDGIPNRVLKEAITSRPALFVKMYNACIKEVGVPRPLKSSALSSTS